MRLMVKRPVPLVMNQDVYTVFADPTETTNDSEIISTIEELQVVMLGRICRSLLDKKDTRYQILATKITLTQANMIKRKTKWYWFQEGTQRVYPEGSLAAQILGFVDDRRVGQYGVEG
jgi:cell division protein FtsI/penicillin-binding protein 2